MLLKTSWYKEIIKQDIRHFGWIGLVYFAVLIFAVPLEILLRLTNDREYYYEGETSVFLYHSELQVLAMFIVPVLLAIFLFRYLQVKGSSDFIHSLPIKREKIFQHHVLTGLSMLLIPVIITGFILVSMHMTMDMDQYFTLSNIGYWFGVTLVVNVLFFMTSVFVGMIAGISAVQGVLTYVLLLFPAGMFILIVANLDFLLIGLSDAFYLTTKIQEYSPLTDLYEVRYRDFELETKGLIYLIISLLFYLLSVFLYKKRKLEAVTQTIVFTQLKPVFKFGFTLCMTLLGGLYFGETQNHFYWVIVGYFLGSIIGYVLAEMLLQKTWRVFLSSWKGYVYYVAVIVITFVTLSFDVTGFENRVPEASDVERVYFNNNPYYFSNKDEAHEQLRYLESEENIKAIIRFHEKVIKQSKRTEFNEYFHERIIIAYELSNGKKLIREYPIQPGESSLDIELKQIYESREFKEVQNEALRVKGEEVEKITISPEVMPTNSPVVLVEPNQIQTALEKLQQDIYNETYDEIVSPKFYISNISILTEDNDQVHIRLKQSYEDLNEWLKKQDLYNDAVVTSNDVSHVSIIRGNSNGSFRHERMQVNESTDDVLVVRDKSQIQTILDNTSGRRSDEKFVIGLFFEGEDYPYIQHFAYGEVPEYVKSYFK